MIPRYHHDDGPGRRFGEGKQRVGEEPLNGGRWGGYIKDIAGDHEQVGFPAGYYRTQALEEMYEFLATVIAVELMTQMPVGGMEQCQHAPKLQIFQDSRKSFSDESEWGFFPDVGPEGFRCEGDVAEGILSAPCI